MNTLPLGPGTSESWPYLPILIRLTLALALGLFVGMERERRGKEAGARTFTFAAILGCLGGFLGDTYALLALVVTCGLMAFLNVQRLLTNRTTELTTSAALLVTGFAGVLVGKGHTFTPVAVAITTAALLAWKEKVTHFSAGLTEAELRSAILLAIIAFVVYPVLPTQTIDPWGLVEPRSAWMTIILISGIGFVNYILLKHYGARGIELSGLLGGLVNSTVAVTDLSERACQDGAVLADAAYRGILLATAAMLVRNGVLLGLLAPSALANAAAPLFLMLAVCVVPTCIAYHRARADSKQAKQSNLEGEEVGSEINATPRVESPFSLQSALKFGAIFLALDAAGKIAQRFLGAFGFYAVSAAGGLVSSASSVASAGNLAIHGRVAPEAAAIGAVLASLASILVNLPLVWRVSGQPELTMRLCRALGVIAVVGVVALLLQHYLLPVILHFKG